MKKIVAVLLLFAMMVAVIPAAQADLMSEARRMLQMINDFRTGGNAWYWNKDNQTVTTKTGLGRLQYDEELEAVALVRAKELAVLFDHTRPDGTDCFTAFPDNREAMGENIASGYPTARSAFEGFLEENENYDGQGHRRIMLSSEMTRVGIAAVEVNGTRYWVQEFASAPTDSNTKAGSGWEQNGDKWYYRKEDGKLVTGWLKQGGKWFYMDRNGAMQTGWLKYNGAWYYLKDSGEMAAGWVNDAGSIYYMNDSGTMATGWKQIDGKWYYFQSFGGMKTGWLKDGKTWYYLRPSGEMATGTVTIDGSTEVFGADGAWKGTQLVDYNTPSSTEGLIERLIKAVWQIVQNLFCSN